MNKQTLTIRQLAQQDYVPCWEQMQQFTQNRTENTPDELWLLEHPPVFTQGQAGKAEHILNPGEIPVVQTDRGGQVTYHGPGQLVAYVLFDLRRLGIGIRKLVENLEETVIRTIADYGIKGEGCRDAPGVYVNGAKICSIGLRVKRGCSYHGIAFNINLDTEPFRRINPCGFQNLQVTHVTEQSAQALTVPEIEAQFCSHLQAVFGYNSLKFDNQRVSIDESECV